MKVVRQNTRARAVPLGNLASADGGVQRLVQSFCLASFAIYLSKDVLKCVYVIKDRKLQVGSDKEDPKIPSESVINSAGPGLIYNLAKRVRIELSN